MTATRPLQLLVVGGSAGALEPLLAIVGALPPALETPIAVLLHLSPRQPSLLPQLLGHVTSRRVREAEDKEPLAPGTIYVAPPDYHLLVERAGTLALSVDPPVNFSRPSIDVLFESAADAFGPGVAALVLSGSNHDGDAGEPG
ncbi:MAG: chemotaxis protein CheB, partial [Deltaproteobacteria bacterium]|nr:chemotaxis protein CheB [Kofleriaceae bacterium]